MEFGIKILKDTSAGESRRWRGGEREFERKMKRCEERGGGRGQASLNQFISRVYL